MDLTKDVEELKGVGPKTAALLKKAGIRTIRDFFYNLPREYENYQIVDKISEMTPGKVVVRGKIEKVSTRRSKQRNLTITEGVVIDDSGEVRVVWFNQKYRENQFQKDREYLFNGTYELKNGRFQLTSPSVAVTDAKNVDGALNPIYVAHSTLKSADFHRLLNNSRDKFIDIPDLIPTAKPGARKEALFAAHFPDSPEKAESAKQYLAYEELFELILASKLNRQENERLKAEPIPFNQKMIKKIVENLPFKLTNAQRVATWEIFQDLEKTTPMNRLLQGDVGSGKTIVAALSAYAAALAKKQVAILAPTAILAGQHYEEIGHLLGKFGVKTALLTGATKRKNELKKQLKSGEIDLVVGTHALITDDTEFSDLALVIIDEQHRFGVEQRQKLVLKSPPNKAPHLLAMTATPIPRSLQLTIFGDLDVSILNELPKGRQPIETKSIPEVLIREDLYPKILEIISKGQQVYWICAAIDDNARLETISVKTRTERLKQLFPELVVEFLHGRMKTEEKEAIMLRFQNGEINILVSTTVVEVGVNVPNATLMVVENAEIYGLAQLHQLRGRVGRGSEKSFCYLLTTGDSRPSKRIRELEKSTDGFYLAEVDLKLRGPGEIYGSLQHGILDLKIASLSDTKLIYEVQKDVDNFLKDTEDLSVYSELMAGIKKYQQLTILN
ncbi:MAG: ATP-dependent DNA helicase RecG [Candidatus Saccharibacteria bacterium]|nr:ATP-dependent DNA helicase RecG [Candidatus Saccharibacteria bacterium]